MARKKTTPEEATRSPHVADRSRSRVSKEAASSPDQFQRFERLARDLLEVPKSEVDEKRKKP